MNDDELEELLRGTPAPEPPSDPSRQEAWDQLRKMVQEQDPSAADWMDPVAPDPLPDPPPPDGAPSSSSRSRGPALLAGAIVVLTLVLALFMRPSPPSPLSGPLAGPLQLDGFAFVPLAPPQDSPDDVVQALVSGDTASPDLHLKWGAVSLRVTDVDQTRVFTRAALIQATDAAFEVRHALPGTLVQVTEGTVRVMCLAVHTDPSAPASSAPPYSPPAPTEVEAEHTLSAGESLGCAPRSASALIQAWQAQHRAWKKSGDVALLRLALPLAQRAQTATAASASTLSNVQYRLWRTHLDLGDRTKAVQAAIAYLSREDRPRRDVVFQNTLVFLGEDCDAAAPLLAAARTAGDVEIPVQWMERCSASGEEP
jgi:ferric-dicitrate binding protein FerR (iron transport regulator)